MKYEFEDFLREKHAEDYQGLDDDMCDAFDDWVTDIEIDDVIKYADEYAKAQRKKFKDVIEETQKIHGKICVKYFVVELKKAIEES